MNKKIKYQRPRLHHFGKTANANCADGSSANPDFTCDLGPDVNREDCISGKANNDYCSSGTVAGLTCSATGSGVGSACGSGTSQ
jgi:predicted metalloprotease